VIKVNVNKDCGNSPKNLFLQRMTIAIAEGDMDPILEAVAEDFCWNKIGEKLIQGKPNLIKELDHVNPTKVEELTIMHALTHGKAGAVDGRIKYNDGKMAAFCDVYEFTNAKGSRVKEIISFVIDMK
jgi:hypothetical protein